MHIKQPLTQKPNSSRQEPWTHKSPIVTDRVVELEVLMSTKKTMGITPQVSLSAPPSARFRYFCVVRPGRDCDRDRDLSHGKDPSISHDFSAQVELWFAVSAPVLWIFFFSLAHPFPSLSKRQSLSSFNRARQTIECFQQSNTRACGLVV